MPVVLRAARPLLASLFVAAGFEALKSLPKRPEGTPLKKDPLLQFRANAAAMLGGGTLLAVGPLPRTAALICAGTLVPTTYVAHPFWKIKDATARREARVHFLKNVSIFGGLIFAASDRSAKAHKAARRAGKAEAAVTAVDTAAAVSRRARRAATKAREAA